MKRTTTNKKPRKTKARGKQDFREDKRRTTISSKQSPHDFGREQAKHYSKQAILTDSESDGYSACSCWKSLQNKDTSETVKHHLWTSRPIVFQMFLFHPSYKRPPWINLARSCLLHHVSLALNQKRNKPKPLHVQLNITKQTTKYKEWYYLQTKSPKPKAGYNLLNSSGSSETRIRPPEPALWKWCFLPVSEFFSIFFACPFPV